MSSQPREKSDQIALYLQQINWEIQVQNQMLEALIEKHRTLLIVYFGGKGGISIPLGFWWR